MRKSNWIISPNGREKYLSCHHLALPFGVWSCDIAKKIEQICSIFKCQSFRSINQRAAIPTITKTAGWAASWEKPVAQGWHGRSEDELIHAYLQWKVYFWLKESNLLSESLAFDTKKKAFCMDVWQINHDKSILKFLKTRAFTASFDCVCFCCAGNFRALKRSRFFLVP